MQAQRTSKARCEGLLKRFAHSGTQSSLHALFPPLPSALARSNIITKTDVVPLSEYRQYVRKKALQTRTQIKAIRRIDIGPFASLTWENYDLIWIQIHEMLHIENGGPQQVDEELEAYNPLIPQQDNLIATFMIEIDDRNRRTRELYRLGHVEDTLEMQIRSRTPTASGSGGFLETVHIVKAEPVHPEQERTTSDGKTSAVHFLKFPLRGQLEPFLRSDEVVIKATHKHYPHMTALSAELLAELKKQLEQQTAASK